MKKFMDEDFLLESETAVKLYHDYAKKMPIIDYHCHVSPKEIFENKQFKNITEAWIYGDHYKWRVMRTLGIEEKYITGTSTDYEKFLAWAKTISMSIGNPLYHWTHLELQRYFGVYDQLNEKTAPIIWDKVNGALQSGSLNVRDIIIKSKVKLICTTDDPTDSLEYHEKLKGEKDFDVRVMPAFRPDKGLGIEKKDFVDWTRKLGEAAGKTIVDYNDFLKALEGRITFFHSVGCRVSDHGLDYMPYAKASKDEVAEIFAKALKGGKVNLAEEKKYKSYTLIYLGKLYSKLNWTMELHMNVARNNNTKLFNSIGPDTGFDSINDSNIAYPLSRFLDSLDREDSLPKTILYSLNPKDNYVIAALIGCFQESSAIGKIQFGAAWWFNDNKDGMIEQMKALSNIGLLSTFLGMLTDSRSFLSYTRHEYFRRILCNMIGSWVENGEAPNDMEALGTMVENISYNNAKDYFGLI
ncbi:MAG TPA: glucuronate isomerase [Clostridiaceae bacterium]